MPEPVNQDELTLDDLDSLDDAVDAAAGQPEKAAEPDPEPAPDPELEQRQLEAALSKAERDLNKAQERVQSLQARRNELARKVTEHRRSARKRPLHELNKRQRDITRAETDRLVQAKEALARANSQMGAGRFSHPKPRVAKPAEE